MSLRAARDRLVRNGSGLLMALALAPCLVAFRGGLSTAQAQTQTPPAKRPAVTFVYHNSRSFRIPFSIDPSERTRIKSILLVMSDDQGKTWQPVSRTSPEKPVLMFRATRDGEFWFAGQTIDTEGRFQPAKTAEVEPRLKVVVDTLPPSIALEANGRKGSLASVRWEIKDDNIDIDSLVLEYQAVGARDWRKVPIRQTGLLGRETWDAGTAEPIKVRGTVADKAKNLKDVTINLPDGTPGNPSDAAEDVHASSAPPRLGTLASGESDGLPQFPGKPALADDFPKASIKPSTKLGPDPTAAPAPLPDDNRAGSNAAAGSGFDPFGNAPRPAAPAASEPSAVKTLLVPSPRFPLQYAVDDAAPGGPALVELWVTRDGGRSWSRRGEDADRQSPFAVDLGAEGTFGLKLVALSAVNQGDQPPVAGEVPQLTVEVDSTPPVVRLDPVQVGNGPNANKVAFFWQASDLHIGPRSVTISVRPEGPNTQWQPIGPAVDNTGRYIWTLPTNAPPKFHVKIDVADEAGNVGSAETPENQAVVIDRSRPKSRIIGLDPSVRSGMRGTGGAFR